MESLNADDQRLLLFISLLLFFLISVILKVLSSFLLLNDECWKFFEISLILLCLLYLCLRNYRLLLLLFLFLEVTVYIVSIFLNNLLCSLIHQHYLFKNIQKRFISKPFFISWAIKRRLITYWWVVHFQVFIAY